MAIFASLNSITCSRFIGYDLSLLEFKSLKLKSFESLIGLKTETKKQKQKLAPLYENDAKLS
jgi:hypothetical protein